MIRSREWIDDGRVCAFDSEEHRYTIDGEQVPGITKILGDLGHLRYYDRYPEARERGQLVHTATQLIDEGLLPESMYVGTEIEPQVSAWCRWRGEQVVDKVEMTAISLARGFGSTVDRIMLSPPFGGTERHGLVDIKTGKPARWHILQMGGLDELFGDTYTIEHLVNVYLDKDGGSREAWHDPEEARAAWNEAFAEWEDGDGRAA